MPLTNGVVWNLVNGVASNAVAFPESKEVEKLLISLVLTLACGVLSTDLCERPICVSPMLADRVPRPKCVFRLVLPLLFCRTVQKGFDAGSVPSSPSSQMPNKCGDELSFRIPLELGNRLAAFNLETMPVIAGDALPLEQGGEELRLDIRLSGLRALPPERRENSSNSCMACGLIRSREECKPPDDVSCTPPNMDTDGEEFL